MRCAVRRAGQDSAGKWKDEFAKDLQRRPLEVEFPNGRERGGGERRLFFGVLEVDIGRQRRRTKMGKKCGKRVK